MDIDEIELLSLFEGRLNLYQYKKGYRFSIDTLLLAAFARQRLRGSVADLGTGSGVLPILLARSPDICSLTGFEIQPDLAELALRNVKLHDLGQRLSIEQADIKEIRSLFKAESFDAAIANPPFYPIGTGRINTGSQDAAARHELLATLQRFCQRGCIFDQERREILRDISGHTQRGSHLHHARKQNRTQGAALRTLTG